MSDIIVEQSKRVRDELIDRFGGIDGYFEHCQAQERAARLKARRHKQPNRPVRKAAKTR